jgi:hypothetical protein
MRHAYDELVRLQTVSDPTLASPYAAADAEATIGANGGTTGNFTITISFPKYGVAVTTGNIAYNAAAATVQTAVDTALDGETILSSYTADDVTFGVCANMSTTPVTMTANGDSVASVDMQVTTANVNMDVDAPEVTVNTVGTGDRPAEALLSVLSVITPAGTVTPQGSAPVEGDYTLGGNPLSVSPGTIDALITEIEVNEDGTLGAFLRALPDCVG